MKKIILTAVLAALLFNCKAPEKNEYNKNEIIFVVEMESNDNKSDNDIAEFSKYYTEAIDNNEPNSLGWGFFKSNDKIYRFENGLIQRSGIIELSTKNSINKINVSLVYGFDYGELLNKTDSFMLKINHNFKF